MARVIFCISDWQRHKRLSRSFLEAFAETIAPCCVGEPRLPIEPVDQTMDLSIP